MVAAVSVQQSALDRFDDIEAVACIKVRAAEGIQFNESKPLGRFTDVNDVR